MTYSLSEISTVAATFEDDLRAYAAAGFDGIGIWEMKLGEDEAADLAAFRASGLRATNCVPAVPSILPNAVIEGPADVDERVRSICASMHRPAPAPRTRRGPSSSTACAGSPRRPTTPASGSGSSRSTRRSATHSRS